MKTLKSVWIGAVCILTVLACAQAGIAQETRVIRVGGALPLADLVNDWAAEFIKSNPNVQISVLGKTAGHGFSQLIEGQTTLVMASRQMTAEEQQRAAAKGMRVGEALVTKIDVAMITNAKNPVNTLTFDQLKDIYSGRTSNWKDVGGPDEVIKVLQRPYPDTGVAVLFKEEILKDLDYRKDALIMSSFKNMVNICEQALAIGHIPSTSSFFDTEKHKIKAFALKKDAGAPALQPNQADYPLNMPFFFAWNANSVPKEVDDFVKFAVNKAKEKAKSSK